MRVAVYGASGVTGGLIAGELRRRGADVVLVGRDAARLEAVAAGAPVRVARVDDAIALATAFTDVAVVVSCAGPFGQIGEPVLEAAIAVGAHYLDISGEQAFLRTMYERHEAAARHAGICAISAMAFEITLGDLAAGWAAAELAGEDDGGDQPVRRDDAGEIATDDPLDEVTVAYVLDRFTPTPGTAMSAIASLSEPGVVWQHDRWDRCAPAAEQRRVNAGPARGGQRTSVSFPSGEVITVPRHVAARRVQTFVSLTRNEWVTRATGLLGPLLPIFARTGLADLLAGMVDPDGIPDTTTRAAAEFTVIASARRRFEEAQVSVSGRDVYAATAVITAWAAIALARRGTGPTGVLAPSQAFAPRAALRALAAEAGLEVSTSFARSRV